MQQKILTYFYPLTGEEFVHSIEENLDEQLKDGWRAVSVGQSVFQTKKKNLNGELCDFNELAVTVLFEKE